MPRGLPATLALTAAATGAGVLIAMRGELRAAAPPSAEPARLEDWFEPARLGRNRRFRRGTWAMALAAAPIGPVAALAMAATGARWRPLLLRTAGGRVGPAGFAAGAGLALAAASAGLPIAAARLAWGRRYGLVVQGTGAWAGDVAKAAAIEAGFAGLAGTTLVRLLRRAPRAWPLGAAGLAAGASVALSALSPLVLEPLFQRARRLEDTGLRDEVLDLARRLGVPARDVLVNDASRRTTALNAYVSGLARTRRIVLFDTLLKGMPRDQVRFVIAHELAHVAGRHVRRRLAWGAALTLPGCLALAGLVAWRTGWERPGPDLALRRLSLVFAGAAVLGSAAAPVAAWASRAHEREADWAAIGATGEPRAAIRAHQTLVTQSLGVPDPPRVVQLLMGSHPSALERIGMALRERG
jgi:STE24 endopeptidase